MEILRVDGPGLMVCPIVGKREEFWIPASLVPNSSFSRAWSFRPRRRDSEGESVRLPRDEKRAETNGPPVILTIPCSIRATAGGVARLALEARQVERATVSWRKEGQPSDIQPTERYRLLRTTDSLCLEIAPCLPSDSGIYYCRVHHETGSCTARIPLRIVGIEARNAWNDDADAHQGSAMKDIDPCHRSIVDDGNDQADEHDNGSCNEYAELDELGLGRFGKVCRGRRTGVYELEVALKQISRSKQPISLTRAEYRLLRSIRHDNIVQAIALLEDTPRPDVDTIVLELVRGPTLFAHFAEQNEYTEATVARYTGQLMSALRWLHSRDCVHLDLKPENVLIDRETDQAKLIDFGEAVRAISPLDEVVPPVDLEFAAPESVLGKPTGSYTDMWAAGVFLYAFLSGLSPFLDDSVEETTTNILKCDFCFPDEYFKDISDDAKNILGRLLRSRGEDRSTARATLTSAWFEIPVGATIPSSRMAAFNERRAHRPTPRQDRNSNSGSSFYS